MTLILTLATLKPHPHQVLPLPANYIRQNWPVQYVSVTEDGEHIAAAGLRGCALYNTTLKKYTPAPINVMLCSVFSWATFSYA